VPDPAIENVIIIGSGPAGYTAALYASRANLNPLMFSGNVPGGQLMITTDVENYPGFPEGIMGPELMELFRKQAERFGTRVADKHVDRVDFSGPPHRVFVGEEEHLAHTVIIATGAEAKWLGLPGEVTYGGYGVSACATCDGFFFRGKQVIVVGGGDTAMEEANFLTRHAERVFVVHRRDELRASKIMQQRAFDNPKIEFVWNSEIVDIHGSDTPAKHVTGVRIRNTIDGKERDMPIEGVFVAIGHKPNSEIFTEWLDLDELGYLVLPGPGAKTRIPGVYACGDVADHVYRQAVTAAGTGCMAAIEAERYLEAREHAAYAM
jgi:thioredoxin reductase (NADPH)